MDRDGNHLVSACLAHLDREEAVLNAIRASLLQTRDALVRDDAHALSAALARQTEVAQQVEEVGRLRADFRRESATLGAVAARVTGEPRERLTRTRERLRKLAAEVYQLSWNNAVLVRHGLDFFRQLLSEITGGMPASQRYERSATPVASVARTGSLLEARG